MTESVKKRTGRPPGKNYNENQIYTPPHKQAGEDTPLASEDAAEDFKPRSLLEKKKIEKLEAEIEKINFEMAVQRGLFVSVEELCKEVSSEYTRVRQKLLALESKLSHTLAPITDPIEVKKIINQEVNEILDELSRDR